MHNLAENLPYLTMEISDIESSESPYGEIEEIIDEVEERFRKLKNFDMLSHPPLDHRYVKKYNLSDKFSNRQKNLAGMVAKVWRALDLDLPDSIYVRAYSMRIELMRVAIIGPKNTPYSNSLFFFDTFFPSNYPTKAPRIFGLGINPSQYANKEISTKLKYNEGTEPSSIIQELLSIQSLLSANQCFSGDQNIHDESFKFTKSLFVQSCETMLHTLSRPPYHFRDLVAGHFRTQAHQILMICRPLLHHDGEPMMQLFAKLITAFQKNGTYCGHHSCLLPEEMRPKEELPEEEQNVSTNL